MATIKFYIRESKSKSKAVIYAHFNISAKEKFRTSTGLHIDPKQWNDKKGFPKNTFPESKNITATLQDLERFILQEYNKDITENNDFKKDWLKVVFDNFFNRSKKVLYFVDFIDEFLTTAPIRKNHKGSLGLSESRIEQVQLFKNTLLEYEATVLKTPLQVKNINNQTIIDFQDYLLSRGYSFNYVGGKTGTFKTICHYIRSKDININVHPERIKDLKEKRKPEDILYLNIEELQQIEDLNGLFPHLENARKWLLLGCQIGQRAGDLLNLTESNIVIIEGVKSFKLTQQKTGKEIYIPLTPKARQIIENGMPRRIQSNTFSIYIKKLCFLAGIKNMVNGRVTRTATTPTQIVAKEKWEFVSSHICRRSFATNYYGKIPTSTLRVITGHATEEMFLRYIGKTAYNHAKEMIQAFKQFTE